MRPFAFVRPGTLEEASALLSPESRPRGGGMDLMDLSKNGVSSPPTLVDLGRVPALDGERPGEGGAIRLGARMTLARIASSETLRKSCPVLCEAAGEAATPLVRNVATLAGNLLQRPRCVYFRDPFFDCLKRGGKSCPAMEGNHAEGAILGNGKCCAVHPSNLAAALMAAGASAMILEGIDEAGRGRWRTAPLDDSFFVRPEEDPLREARLAPGEILAEVVVPSRPASAYVEVDQKQSFDWASASCAVALRMEGGKVAEARVVLGAVAPVPWRAKEAEAALAGRVPDEKAAQAAAEAAVKGATPLRDNAHKVQHLRVCVKRAILRAAERGK